MERVSRTIYFFIYLFFLEGLLFYKKKKKNYITILHFLFFYFYFFGGTLFYKKKMLIQWPPPPPPPQHFTGCGWAHFAHRLRPVQGVADGGEDLLLLRHRGVHGPGGGEPQGPHHGRGLVVLRRAPGEMFFFFF